RPQPDLIVTAGPETSLQAVVGASGFSAAAMRLDRAPSSIRSNLVFRRDGTKLHFFRSSTTKFELVVNFKMARTKMVSNPVSNNPKNVPLGFRTIQVCHRDLQPGWW